MGQNTSSQQLNRYLIPLPEIYEKNNTSEVYSLKDINQNHDFSLRTKQNNNINSSQSNPQIVPSNTEKENKLQGQHNHALKQQHKNIVNKTPPFLKHFTLVLNKFQTQSYLNHLVYRNQQQFKQFVIQIPFGQIEKHKKYTKLHLYAQQIILTLNQISNMPFEDMCNILYTSLLAYKYLYSYFGFFKVQANMIGLTRQGKAKVWLNSTLTKDKPLPIISDINLKRFKQQQSYMVDDLLNIMFSKVDRESVPSNFTLFNNNSNIRASRLGNSRLGRSRVESDKQLSQSMMNSLENNLILDFSDRSFDKCLEYLENYMNIQRLDFIKNEAKFINKQQTTKKSSNEQKQSNIIRQERFLVSNDFPFQNISSKRRFINFLPSIIELLKIKKQLTDGSSQLRNSRVNVNINLKQILKKQSKITYGLTFQQQNLLMSNIVSNVKMGNSEVNFNCNKYGNTITHPQINHRHAIFSQKSSQKNLTYSKSKPKIAFNNVFTQNPQIITSDSNISSTSNYNSSQKINSQQAILTKSMANSSASIYQNRKYENDLQTSQVQAIYSFSKQNQKSRNHEEDDKYQSSSIIDVVMKV